MIHLIYTFTEAKAPRDGSGIKKTARVYRIKRGSPELIVSRTDTFVDEGQLVLEALATVRKEQRLPPAMFEKNQFGGYPMLWTLRDKGIININKVY